MSFDLCEHCVYTLTPTSGLPLPPKVIHSLAPAFWVPSSLHTHTTPEDTPAPAKHPQCPTEPPYPAAGPVPAELSPQRCPSLLLFPPTAAQEKSSAEGGGHWVENRGQAFFGKQRWPLSTAAACPAGPDCTSVCCGTKPLSSGPAQRHLQGYQPAPRREGWRVPPTSFPAAGMQTLHPHQQLQLHSLNPLARSKGGCKRHRDLAQEQPKAAAAPTTAAAMLVPREALRKPFLALAICCPWPSGMALSKPDRCFVLTRNAISVKAVLRNKTGKVAPAQLTWHRVQRENLKII